MAVAQFRPEPSSPKRGLGGITQSNEDVSFVRRFVELLLDQLMKRSLKTWSNQLCCKNGGEFCS